MLSDKMVKALNKQINAELYSSYLYLSMAAQAESKNLKGMANWFRVQAQEELGHAMKFFLYVTERGGRVVLEAIEKPATEWAGPLPMFEETVRHEQKVTSLIHGLVDLAIETRDHATNSLLKWFVDEQVEEEATAGDIVNKLKLAGDQGAGLFMIDQELSTRTFVYPPAALGAAV